jgi:N-acetylglutamate synthase-like GNAT family acetyltransferase
MTFNERYYKLLKEEEAFSDVTIMTYDEYLNKKKIGTMSDIVAFCNKMLPKSPMTDITKRNLYERAGSIMLIAVDEEDGAIAGFLESYMSEGVRLLANGGVTEKYRKLGLCAKLWEIMREDIPQNKVVLHFRDSNMKQLHFYESMGFTDLTNVGEYMNGETKWEMTLFK